ncbi:MAG TPA: MFS transporter [Verrucomicrobiae bacterium]|nr:MFS transporter [Verrucomicrobiae bacterium]
MEDPEISAEQAEAPGAAAAGSYDVLKNRDFLVYLVGRFVASLGQQMLSVAVDWELYERTHSALVLGLVGLAQMIPMFVCTLPAGHVADNFSRKQVILATTLLMAAASFGLMFISAVNAPVAWIYLCLVFMGAGRTFLWPASAAFLPHLVPRSQFTQAVTFNSGTFQLSSVLGPAVSGVLIALLIKVHSHPAAAVYALNGVASLTCFGLVLCIRRQHTVASRQPLSLSNLGAGFKFVFSNKIILGTITLDMFAVFLGGAVSLLPIYAKDILKAGPDGLGLLRAAMPIGAVLCALFLTHRPPLQKAGRAMLWSVAIFGVATILFGLSHWFWISFLMLFICGAVDNVSVVVRHALVQLLTPDEKRGRVSAVNSLFIGTSNELGGFESGFVAQLLGPTLGNSIAMGATLSVVTGGFGTILVVVAVAWIWPEIRKYGRLEGPG